MSADDTLYQLYRCINPIGQKDWAIGIATEGQIRIRSGATGSPAKLDEMPVVDRDRTEQEIGDQIARRLAKGFTLVGPAKMQKGRLELYTPRLPGIDWEIVEPIERKELLSRLGAIASALSSDLSPARLKMTRMSLRVQSLPPWVIGFTQDGGIEADGRGRGTLEVEEGVIPRLVIASLHLAYADRMRIVSADRGSITPRLAQDDPLFAPVVDDWEWVIELGARLQLRESDSVSGADRPPSASASS